MGLRRSLFGCLIVTVTSGGVTAQESAPTSRRSSLHAAWVELQDGSGHPLRAARVQRVTLGRTESESRPDPAEPNFFRLDWGGYETGKDGKAYVMVPPTEEIPPLVVFKPGYRYVEIPRPVFVNRIVLRDGVRIRGRLPAWLTLPPDMVSVDPLPEYRNVTIDFLPASDEVWWKSQSVSLYDRRATTGGRSPRLVEFTVEPGRYKIQCSLVPYNCLETTLAKSKISRGELRGPEVIAVSPDVVTIPDTKELISLELELDRAAYEKSDFANLRQPRPESRW